MKHQLIWIILLVALWHTPVHAQTSFTPPVIEQLEKQGYTVTKVRRTLLGRILIVAKNGPVVREIVINRKNGQILHDHTFNAPQSPTPLGGLLSAPNTGSRATAPSPPGGISGGIGGGFGGFGGGIGGGFGGGFGN